MGIMQGLRILYIQTARRPAWRQLVSDLVPDFIDPASGEPLVGREHYWSLVTEYRVRLAVEERNWVEGERLQRLCVDWHRQRANVASGGSDESRHHAIQGLPTSLQSLGDIQREQGDPTCATTFREALDLATANGDAKVQANCAFQLGNVFLGLAELRNLDEAERWYRMCHDLVIPNDRFVRGMCIANLGSIALERFRDARTAKRPAEELASHLAEAARLYKQAFDVLPAIAVRERGIVHTALGVIYNDAGDIDRAHHHYRQSIQYADKTGDIFHAGKMRYEFAFALWQRDRLTDARVYAEAALANFQTFGHRAADNIRETELLIAAIDKAIAEEAGGV